MPTRAWILLKHLEQWRAWNSTSEHELFQKIDMDKSILMGHSRGGEAVPIAAAFNKLPFFPDNTKEEFDFNFNIKGLVAIAPTDHRYTRRIELENINYLSLQGSYDSDEASFFGLRQLQRIAFTDSNKWLKAGVYIHGANHGQFNSIWGRKDSGAPWNWILNLNPIIPGPDQRKLGKIYITAFAEVVFNEDDKYTALLNGRKNWFPELPILQNYKTSGYKPFITYENDLDVTRWSGGAITTTNLSLWKEIELTFRDDDSQGVNGVLIGWDDERKTEDKSKPSYRINFKNLANYNSEQTLVINLASIKPEKDSIDSNYDFRVILTDSLNKTREVIVSSVKPVTPPLQVQYLKLKDVNDDVYGSIWEAELEDIRIDLSKFEDHVDLSSIRQIKLQFDLSKKGQIFVNEIGIESSQ